MPPKVAARVARDPRQFRLGEGGLLEPSRALSERIDVALAAGAAFRRVDRNYELGATGLLMTKGVRFALRRVTALGLDRSAFEMKAKEVSVNIPVIRSRGNGVAFGGWCPPTGSRSAQISFMDLEHLTCLLAPRPRKSRSRW